MPARPSARGLVRSATDFLEKALRAHLEAYRRTPFIRF